MSKNQAGEENEALQAQIGVSISLARSVVASWLPPLTDAERLAERNSNPKATSSALLVDRRAPFAGLGSTGEKDDSANLSLEELKLKRKLLQKRKKIQQEKTDLSSRKQRSTKEPGKLGAGYDSVDSSGEEETRKGQKKSRDASLKTASYDTFTSRSKDAQAGGRRRGFGR